MPNWANLLGPMASTRSDVPIYLYIEIYPMSNLQTIQQYLLINLHQVASASKFYDLRNQKP